MSSNIHTFVVLAYKESKYLEECIKSVLNQSYKSRVVIATTTDNKYIRDMASKYKLDVIVGKHTTIGGDFDFARTCVDSKLITIAHQDDIYDKDYAAKVIKYYNKYNNSLIIFTDYYEIRGEEKEYSNKNLFIKRVLIVPLRLRVISKYKFIKRLVLRFGNSICCPAVTFVSDNCPKEVFTCDFKSDCDWYGWEKLSKCNGRFVYITKKLMGHRISDSSTTTDIINKGIRTKEDLIMFSKFWPKGITKLINKIYSSSEKSNNIK